MRIAYLTQSYPPVVSGAAIVVKGLAEAMARRGHQVLVLTSSENGSPYQTIKPNLTVIHFRSYRNPLRVGQSVALWPHAGILAALRQFRPDLIHSHEPFQFSHSGRVYARWAGIPIALTAHQLPWFVSAYLPKLKMLDEVIENFFWIYSRLIIHRFDAVIAPSETVASVLAQKTGIKPQVIGFGLDPANFYPGQLSEESASSLREKFGLPRDVSVLLHVGRLDLDKHADVMIRAAALVMQKYPVHLLVVGDGTERARLIQLCQKLGIGQRCHFPGFIEHADGLPDIYRMSSVFINASGIETQGLVYLEAAACGLPIAAVRATCVPEIVHDGQNGFLARPGDVQELAACIERLVSDPVKAHAMGLEGSLLARKFSVQGSIDAHEQLYLENIQFNSTAEGIYRRAKSRRVRLKRSSDSN